MESVPSYGRPWMHWDTQNEPEDMCGRFTNRKITKDGFVKILEDEGWDDEDFPPRFNVGPGKSAP